MKHQSLHPHHHYCYCHYTAIRKHQSYHTLTITIATITPSQSISHITPSPSLLLPSPLPLSSPQTQHPASLLPAGGMVQDRSLSHFLLLLLLLWGGTHHHPAAGGVSGHVLHQGESSVTCNTTTGTLGMVGLWVMSRSTGVVGRF